MGQDSKIEWTHHTFNPWWGCVKVSPACKYCYAEAWANRLGLELWGETSRRTFGDSHWREPLRWQREAASAGVRRRVFCASMADVFEDRRELDGWRDRLWALIQETPGLDWLLLTKRPEAIGDLAPWRSRWPRNIWLGTTVESQEWAELRLPFLLKHPAAVRFVSCEPLLGPLDLRPWLVAQKSGRRTLHTINWVIAGGESGAKARPMHPHWAESLRDQCRNAEVPFHFKQWGHWGPETQEPVGRIKTIDLQAADGKVVRLFRLGKHAAGRSLEGRTWDEYPTPRTGGRQ